MELEALNAQSALPVRQVQEALPKAAEGQLIMLALEPVTIVNFIPTDARGLLVLRALIRAG